MSWSTNLSSGTVTENNLTNWTLQLISSGSPIYTDNAIINSVVQSIGGVNRTISSLDFGFDLGTNTLNLWDNDVSAVQVGAASGITYNIYKTGANAAAIKFNNGVSLGGAGPTYSQSTIITPDAVPFEFNPGLGLILLGVGYGIQQVCKRGLFQKVKLEEFSVE